MSRHTSRQRRLSAGHRALLLTTIVAPLLYSLACSPSGTTSTPTHRVERQAFVHKITVEGQLEAVQSTQLTVPMDAGRVRLAWLEDEGKRVEAGHVVARFDAKTMQRLLEDGQGDLDATVLEVDQKRIEGDMEIGRLATAFESADMELNHAQEFQKLDDTVYARRDILQDAIDSELAQARKDHAEQATETQQQLTSTELDLLSIKQRQSKLEIDRAEDALTNLEVRAPHAGLLQLSRDWRGEPPLVGAEMWRGQSIGQIPDLSSLQARVFVLEADAGGLAEGKTATVTVEAFPQNTYDAKILSVEALAKPRVRGSPVQYFGVLLELAVTDTEVMKPGSRVQTTLFLEQLDDALVVPRQAIFQRQGAPHVYVRQGTGFVPRPVELGTVSLGWAVVQSGLEAGTEVAMAEPTELLETQESPAQSQDDVVESEPDRQLAPQGTES